MRLGAITAWAGRWCSRSRFVARRPVRRSRDCTPQRLPSSPNRSTTTRTHARTHAHAEHTCAHAHTRICRGPGTHAHPPRPYAPRTPCAHQSDRVVQYPATQLLPPAPPASAQASTRSLIGSCERIAWPQLAAPHLHRDRCGRSGLDGGVPVHGRGLPHLRCADPRRFPLRIPPPPRPIPLRIPFRSPSGPVTVSLKVPSGATLVLTVQEYRRVTITDAHPLPYWLPGPFSAAHRAAPRRGHARADTYSRPRANVR